MNEAWNIACRRAADAAVDGLLEFVSEYMEASKSAGSAEIIALIAGQREAIVLRLKETAFQVAAESLEPERFGRENATE